jgi:hypothetical protein
MNSCGIMREAAFRTESGLPYAFLKTLDEWAGGAEGQERTARERVLTAAKPIFLNYGSLHAEARSLDLRGVEQLPPLEAISQQFPRLLLQITPEDWAKHVTTLGSLGYEFKPDACVIQLSRN